jgi:hypothetical protein
MLVTEKYLSLLLRIVSEYEQVRGEVLQFKYKPITQKITPDFDDPGFFMRQRN